MRLIDTHAHLQYSFGEIGDNATQPKPDSLEEISAVVARAKEVGVVKMLNVGTSLADSAHVNKISENFGNVFKVFGVHPHNAHELASEEGRGVFEKLLDQGCPVAIGEIGLDFYQMQNSKDEQFVAFEYQLKLAKEKGLPVCIHTRDAFAETHELLKRYGSRGLIHSFTGDYDWAMKFIDLGFLIAFNGIVTFKNSKSLQDAAQRIPLEKMLLETDSPFLSPEPERGKVNEPAKVRFTAAKIAELRGITVEEVGEETSRNAENLFGI